MRYSFRAALTFALSGAPLFGASALERAVRRRREPGAHGFARFSRTYQNQKNGATKKCPKHSTATQRLRFSEGTLSVRRAYEIKPNTVNKPRMPETVKAMPKKKSPFGSTNGSMIQYATKLIGHKTLVTPEINRNAAITIVVPSNVRVERPPKAVRSRTRG